MRSLTWSWQPAHRCLYTASPDALDAVSCAGIHTAEKTTAMATQETRFKPLHARMRGVYHKPLRAHHGLLPQTTMRLGSTGTSSLRKGIVERVVSNAASR